MVKIKYGTPKGTRKHQEIIRQTETAVSEFMEILKNKDILFKSIIRGIKILVLSCDQMLRSTVRDRLKKYGYTAYTVDEIKPFFPDLPEFEVETQGIDWVDIIVAIEDAEIKDNKRCNGLVQECTLIMMTPHYQSKTIYICPNSVEKKRIRSLKGGHYIYFPNIEQIDYGMVREELVEEICSIVKKETHRLAHNANRNYSRTTVKNICEDNKK